jgi:hypothetical protein
VAASVVIAVTLNLWETRGQTFFSDEWGRLLFYNHGGLETLLRGYSGHLVVLHALLYKGLLNVFGADSYLPFRVTEALLMGAAGSLFYALARSRYEPWHCVFATLVLLFLGSAFEVLATPYGIVMLLPVTLGLAALVCLERLPGRGDPLACLLLVAALASQSVGLAFLVGAAIVLIQQSGRAALARMWVVLTPGALYVAWFAWSRLTGPNIPDPVQLHNVTQVPSSVVEVCAAGLAAITGLFGSSGFAGNVPFDLTAGYLALGLLIIAGVWRVRSGWEPRRHVWVPIAIALTFWALIGMVANIARGPTASRYLYPSAVFLLLIVLELVRGLGANRRLIWFGVGALVVSLVPNLVNLNYQARQIRNFAGLERTRLGALELLRQEVPAASVPALQLQGQKGVIAVDPHGTIPAASYFAAVDRYGSPADSPPEIAGEDESLRSIADGVLLEGKDLALFPVPARQANSGQRCRVFRPASSGKPFSVPSSGVEIQRQSPGIQVTVLARRFATQFQRLTVPAGARPLLLRPGRSHGVRPWIALVRGAAVCAVR